MLTLVKQPPRDARDFYANLPALPEYTQMVDARYYQDLPDEWVIVMTDVRGSTQAIEAGLYKEVNMVVRCAKLRISSTQTLALVRGDGWALAEQLTKEHEGAYALPEDAATGGDFTGLECRWNPLPARKSEVMALIVQSRVAGVKAEEIFRDILADAMDEDNKPIRLDSIKLRWPPKFLYAEARVRVRGSVRRLIYYVSNLTYVGLQVLYVKWRERPAGRDKPIIYLRELTENTDYVKFDECLRMVIDISLDQKARILAKLDAYARAGQIDYGYHSDRNALMTCFIEGPGKHIHFVDAAGGGYAMAAKKLKEAKRSRGAQ